MKVVFNSSAIIKKVVLCVWSKWNKESCILSWFRMVVASGPNFSVSNWCGSTKSWNKSIWLWTTESALWCRRTMPSTARKIKHRFQELDGIDVLAHTANSPDYAPSDYGLFRSMEHLSTLDCASCLWCPFDYHECRFKVTFIFTHDVRIFNSSALSIRIENCVINRPLLYDIGYINVYPSL